MTKIQQLRQENYGFITKDDLPAIIAENRLQQCLVRCGGCRFVCPAQDVTHLVEIIDASADYVRDVSFPARG